MLYYPGKLFGHAVYLLSILAFRHNTDQRFRAGGPQEYAPGIPEPGLGLLHGVDNIGTGERIKSLRHPYVDHLLGQLAHALSQLLHGHARGTDRQQHLQGRDDTVTGTGAIPDHHMPGPFTTYQPVIGQQALHHIMVADLRTLKLDTKLPQRELHTQIGHQGAYHTSFEPAFRLALGGKDIQKLIAVHFGAVAIDHQNPVAVPVERYPEIRLPGRNRLFQCIKMGGAHVKIDVQAIWAGTNHGNPCSELPEHLGRYVVGGTVGAVQHNMQALKSELIRYRAFAELHVPAGRIINATGLAQLVGATYLEGLVQPVLNLRLQRIIELGAVGREELDAIVVVGIMGGTDYDAGRGTKGSGEIGNRRSRHRAQQFHIHTGGRQACLKGRLKHIAGQPGILADQHTVTLTVLLERLPCRPAKMQHELRCNRLFTNAPTNTIRSKILTLRHQIASFTAVTTFTASAVSLTSCTLRMLAPFMADIVAAARLAGNLSLTSRPVIAPNIDLRDSPISKGWPSICNCSRVASSWTLCPTVLPNPNPGSRIILSGSTPAASATRMRSVRNELTSRRTFR